MLGKGGGGQKWRENMYLMDGPSQRLSNRNDIAVMDALIYPRPPQYLGRRLWIAPYLMHLAQGDNSLKCLMVT